MSALRSVAAVMAGVGTGLVARKDDEEKKVATDTTTKTVSPSSKKMADSLKSGTFTQDYMGAPKPVPANTGSTQLDYYINKIKGITG